MSSYDRDGNPRWIIPPASHSWLSYPTIGSDSTLYIVRNYVQLAAVDQDGSPLWENNTVGVLLTGPAVSPDGNQLIAAGIDSEVGGSFLSFSSADGALRWEEQLAQESDGTLLRASTRAIFSADGEIAFAGVEAVPNPNGNFRCYLYALDTNQSILFANGFESGTLLGWTMTVTP